MELVAGIHRFPTGLFNWYLMVEGGRATLIDGGFPGHYATFRRGMETLGLAIQDIEAILLTHAHADHMGILERVRRESGGRVLVGKADVNRATLPYQLPWWALLSNGWRPQTARMLLHATSNGVFWGRPLAKAEAVPLNVPLDIPGRPIALATPGHTAGETCFYVESSQLLFTGDALATISILGTHPAGPQLLPHFVNDDDGAAQSSLDRLRQLGTLTLLPGHGAPWRGDLAVAVGEALALRASETGQHARRREEGEQSALRNQ